MSAERNSHSGESNDDTTTKKRKKNLRVPIAASTGEETPKPDRTERPKREPTPAEKALANLLATKRAEETDSTVDKSEPRLNEADHANKTSDKQDGSTEKAQDDSQSETDTREADNHTTEADKDQINDATINQSRIEQTDQVAMAEATDNGNSETDESTPESVDKPSDETWHSRELNVNELNLGEGVREVVVDLRSEHPEATEARPEPIPLDPRPDEGRQAELRSREDTVAQNGETASEQWSPLADGGGEKPPVDPPRPEGSSVSPEPDPEPGTNNHHAEAASNTATLPPEVYSSELFRSSDESGSSTFSPSFEAASHSANDPNRLVTQSELNDSMYRAEKAGQNRGVLTGLLVGGAYEHFKHKRREKRLRKDLEKQGRRLEQAEKRFTITEAEHNKNQHDQERRFAKVQKELANRPAEKAEKQPVNHETRIMKQPQQEITVPEGHHLETSAWHTIEVDNKTGRTVENSSIAYGHEYYQERRSESGQHDGVTAVAGEMAVLAAAGGGQHAGEDVGNTDKDEHERAKSIPSASTSGAPSKRDKLQSAAKSFKTGASTSDGPVWPLVVILVVVIAIIFLVLR